ncbi:hypothetical protein [Phytohabitans suffuscus]|uniref:hypothetical protein n=1 Tax=Phytohabitans suffuscus TaxID=624315 RepID=UPI0022B2A9FB|nr:hypothetical protein [Phytohabitans suffuscus]
MAAAARPGVPVAGRRRPVRLRRAVRRRRQPGHRRGAELRGADVRPKGQVYDGWETRRRREPGSDQAIVRLGAPGIVRGIVVDTAFFTGNYPPYASVEGWRSAAIPARPSWPPRRGRRWCRGPRSPATPATSSR